ncbi:MAG: anion permease, partial [Victivallales bacterium]|nr:anion permease [Victivallales bacterium]
MVFICTIIGILFQVLPTSALTIVLLSLLCIFKFLDPAPVKNLEYALSGFANGSIWLILCAFFISRAIVKTGLGKRISYIFIKFLGKRTLTLSYGVALSDLVLAPSMPSNTARNGGIIYPILKSLCMCCGSRPEDGTEKKVGRFLLLCQYQCDIVISSMFLTAMAANPLAAKLAQSLDVHITWNTWFIAAAVPGIISLILIPLILYKIYPPEIKKMENAAGFGTQNLIDMGRMKKNEYIVLFVFILLLILWVFGPRLNLQDTSVALLGLALLLATAVLQWEDIINEKAAWDTFVWFAILLMMADNLDRLGFMNWLSSNIHHYIGNLSWLTIFFVLILIYTYIHYIFASQTAHVAAFYTTFLALGISMSVPPLLMALALGFASNLFAGLTHYASSAAPIYMGSKYIKLGDWWRYGLIFNIINMAIWFGIGMVWWKII